MSSSVRAVVFSLVASGASFALTLTAAESQTAETRQFISCPRYRDTDMGRKSGCWLADDPSDGARYDVTWAPIKPQVGKPVLIEGVVTTDADTCGGVVLDPVRVSVLEGRCPTHIVPAEAYPGRPSPPPAAVLAPANVPRELPPPPYDRREFSIYFEFGRDFLIYQHAEVVLEQISLYVRASRAETIAIHGYAATAPVRVSRRRIAEDLTLAGARANMVREALIRSGSRPIGCRSTPPEHPSRPTWKRAGCRNRRSAASP